MISKDTIFNILLVEDNEAEAELTREALESSIYSTSLSVVRDGEQAMLFLRQTGEYQHAPRPDLILLDLNMPKKDGREVLKEIKEDHALLRIPVVVLTTSQDASDIQQTYSDHANSFITKPLNFDHFINIIRKIEEYWFTIVKMPLKASL